MYTHVSKCKIKKKKNRRGNAEEIKARTEMSILSKREIIRARVNQNQVPNKQWIFHEAGCDGSSL
jgi:hypothetical protein